MIKHHDLALRLRLICAMLGRCSWCSNDLICQSSLSLIFIVGWSLGMQLCREPLLFACIFLVCVEFAPLRVASICGDKPKLTRVQTNSSMRYDLLWLTFGSAIVRVKALLGEDYVLIWELRGNWWKCSTPDLSILARLKSFRWLGKRRSVFKGRLFFTTAVTSRLVIASLWVGSQGFMMRVKRTRFKYLLDSRPTRSFVFESLITLFQKLLFDVFSLEEFLGLDARALGEIARDTNTR